MDILRKFEDESLFRIQQFQEALEELSDEELKLAQKKREADLRKKNLNSTIKKLEHDKFELEKKIKAKQQFLTKELLAHTQNDNDSEDAENPNLSSTEAKGRPPPTRESQLATLAKDNTNKDTPTSKIEEILTGKIDEVFKDYVKQPESDLFGDKGNVGKMQAIENAFDVYLIDYYNFHKQYEPEWTEARKIHIKDEKKATVERQHKWEAAQKVKDKEDQLKNIGKKRKPEGRRPMARMFLQKKENTVVEVEVDEDYLDEIKYFT